MSLIESDRRHIWHPFTQAGIAPDPIVIEKAEGAFLHAQDGRRFIDLISSWWVNLHGHAHPAIAKAIADQACRLEQVIFADFTHQPAISLASRIAAVLPGGLNRVFFSDNGSSAVEVALKIAVQYWSNRGTPKHRFIAFEGGYHGDTVGAMSAGRRSGFFDAWKSLMFPVEFAPFPATWMNDTAVEEKETAALAALAQAFERNRDQVAAVIIEPLVQGAGGMRMCRPDFIRALVDMARSAGALVIFDEVMTGFGRTGSVFACVKAGIEPDLICLSKGLSGGFLPLSMTVAQDDIYQAFYGEDIAQAFLHGHSFTANPLGCAAALASLDLLETPQCQDAIRKIESIHRHRLAALPENARNPRITGTIAAFDVTGARDLKRHFFDQGLVLRPLGDAIYLLPPYCLTEEDLHRAYDRIEAVLSSKFER